jgi:hypothetical protein
VTVLLLALLSCGAGALAAAPVPSTTSATSPATRPVPSAELARKLDQHLPELKADALGISDILDFLRDRDINVHVNWRSLARRGIDRNTPITITLHDESYARVFDRLLEKVNPRGKQRICWCADENVLLIALESDLPHYQAIKQRFELRRWDEPTRAALAADVAALRLDAWPLEDSLRIIWERTALRIVLDRDALNRSGIDAKTPVNINVKNVTGRDVAAMVLFDLDPKGRLALAPRAGKAVITAREAFHVNDPVTEEPRPP